MGLPTKKGKEVVFEKVKPQQSFTLENQGKKMKDIKEADIKDYLEELFYSEDEFVILTAPKAQNSVRYVQACIYGREVEVELGIEREGTHLYYKMCSQEECCRIFLDFYGDTFIPNMEEYRPVEF